MTLSREYNPIVIFLYYMAVTVPAMFIMNPVLLGISLFGAVVCFYAERRKGRQEPVFVFVGLFLLLAALNPLFHHNGVTVLFMLNDNPITLEALFYGLTSSTMVIAVIFWFRSFSYLMTGDRLLYVFGKVSPRFSLMISMALRYIPLFSRQAAKIRAARRGMGAYEEENLPASVKNGVKAFVSLAGWSLENGIITADSMEARGYGAGKRTFYSLYRFRASDGIALSLILLLTGAVIICKIRGALDFVFYPETDALPLSGEAVFAYVCYFILTVLPLINKMAEKEKWRYLRSKI